MTRYIELLGLPGSGKTTILRALAKSADIVGSELSVCPAPSLASAYHRHLRSQLFRGKTAWRQRDWWLSISALGWAEACQMKHYRVFSKVFETLCDIPEGTAGRDKLLAYWKIRLSEYDRISINRSPTLVDEGVTQTAFSTLARVPSESAQLESQIELLLGELPVSRTVIFLNTPLHEAVARSRRGKPGLNRMTSLKSKTLLDEVWGVVQRSAVTSFEVDGSLDVANIQAKITEKLTTIS